MKRGLRRKAVILILAVVILWLLWGNTALEVNTYKLSSDRIPMEFDGFRIAQISDFHNTEFGEGNRKFLELLSDARPDIIVITGDLVDSRRTDVEVSLNLARELTKIAPVYYVSGNHEARIGEYQRLQSGLTDAGVTVLKDQVITLDRNGAYIQLAGIDDPAFRWGDDAESTARVLAEILPENSLYTIVLSHRPELFETYVDSEVDLVFSGHAHGGQFRLPFVGGLFAPKQGFFPEYDAGVYEKDNTAMIVSRGIGNSIIPLRFNNRPEIVLAELRAETG
jgi:predicted MPP superfamily phosphohydrolase